MNCLTYWPTCGHETWKENLKLGHREVFDDENHWSNKDRQQKQATESEKLFQSDMRRSMRIMSVSVAGTLSPDMLTV